MLDAGLKQQVEELFDGISSRIALVYDESSHAKQGELRELLEQTAALNPQLEAQSSGRNHPFPRFEVHREGVSTGLSFVGIPGGHEFSSFVLAILNSAGKGKLPDEGLAQRIRRLPAGLQLRTYISLTCENCPDVVQALQQIVLAHGQLSHEMIDGSFVQEELDRLKIQGVPSVFAGQELIHSGRSSLSELIGKLEAKFTSSEVEAKDLGMFDVAVVGGGPAGASAAIYSVRKGLKTVLIAERLGGQVQETKGIENLISVIYTEGPQLAANLDQHLRSYPVTVLEHRKVSSVSANKEIVLSSGERLQAKAIIVATGAKWRELGVPGEKEYIGRGVAFCPHCDGPYYKGKKVAVVGGGNSGVEAAIDLAGVTNEVVLLEFADQLKADEILVQKLRSLPNVSILTGVRTTEVVGDGEKVKRLDYEVRATGERQFVPLDGVFVQIGLSPNSGMVKEVVETTPFGEIVVDAKGRTSVPGIYAAGDVTTVPFKQIVIAMGEGAKVALTAFEDRMRA